MFVLATGFVPNALVSQVNTLNCVQHIHGAEIWQRVVKKFVIFMIETCDLNDCPLLCPAQLKAMTK